MKTCFLPALVCGCVAPSVAGQTAGYVLETIYQPGHNSVTADAPSAVVRVSAIFPRTDFAFSAARWDLHASEKAWGWAECIPPLQHSTHCPGNHFSGGASLTGLIVGQLHFPPVVLGNPINPAPLVEAEWETQDFGARRVRLWTFTHRFDAYPSATSPASASRLGVLTEGTGEILVGECLADCDTSTGAWVLDVFDFVCFQNRFAAGVAYACDCDTSTGPLVCDVFDFLCFQSAFAIGCP